MPSHTDVYKILELYPAFHVRRWLSRLGLRPDLLRLNIFIAVLFLLLIFLAASLDSSLLLKGRNAGLLQHPAIFAFLATQCVLPYAAARSLTLLLTMKGWGTNVLKEDFLRENLPSSIDWLEQSASRQNNIGRVLFNVLSMVGFGAFVWNSISNQRPFYFVGFDVWDSAYHPWGYFITRIYKFYMWTLFFPALVHVEIITLICMRRLLLRAVRQRSLVLEPFHPDECGGARAFIDTVLIPLLPALAISSALAISALFTEKKFDLLTVGALTFVCCTFLSLYLIMAGALRSAIVAEKARQLGLIADIQNTSLFNLLYKIDNNKSPDEVSKTIEALSSLSRRIKDLPNWPQLRLVVRAVVLAAGSPIVGWIAKALSPKIATLLGL